MDMSTGVPTTWLKRTGPGPWTEPPPMGIRRACTGRPTQGADREPTLSPEKTLIVPEVDTLAPEENRDTAHETRRCCEAR